MGHKYGAMKIQNICNQCLIIRELLRLPKSTSMCMINGELGLKKILNILRIE